MIRRRWCSYLFALGGWRVKPVVRKVPGEDVQFARDNPPGIAEFQLILWREKSFELPGKHHVHGGRWRRPVPEPRQSNVRNLQTQREHQNS